MGSYKKGCFQANTSDKRRVSFTTGYEALKKEHPSARCEDRGGEQNGAKV